MEQSKVQKLYMIWDGSTRITFEGPVEYISPFDSIISAISVFHSPTHPKHLSLIQRVLIALIGWVSR